MGVVDIRPFNVIDLHSVPFKKCCIGNIIKNENSFWVIEEICEILEQDNLITTKYKCKEVSFIDGYFRPVVYDASYGDPEYTIFITKNNKIVNSEQENLTNEFMNLLG